MSTASAAIYHDFQGLSALRAEARNASSETVEEVAGQFESLFTQMMLKSMREATSSLESGLFESDQMDTYQSMFDQQLSLDLSRHGALGLSDILVEQLGGSKQPQAAEEQVDQAFFPLRSKSANTAPLSLNLYASSVSAANDASAPSTEHQQIDNNDWKPDSPEAFIRGVWSHALAAANTLGLDPEVLVAQSALETGWGARVIQSVNGSSFNLFGIKADSGWSGESASVNSLEVSDGIAAMERAAFRVYDSIASSFDDYVRFLTSNPRYQNALANVADSGGFLSELQQAGYATDPGYADKIMGIIGQTSFGSVIDALKK
ncbi:MAG: flagellar protein FlgJ [Alcanivorax sp.]|jgi:flagellar protein FlgJ